MQHEATDPQDAATMDHTSAVDHDGLEVLDASIGFEPGGVAVAEIDGAHDDACAEHWLPPTQEPLLDPELVAILCGSPEEGSIDGTDGAAGEGEPEADADVEGAADAEALSDSGTAPQDGALQDGEAQDGEAQDGEAQDGEAQDGPLQDGVAQDGVAQDGVAQDGDADEDGDDGVEFDHEEAVRSAAALLFASPEALSPRRLGDLLGGARPKTVAAVLTSLGERFEAAGLPFVVRELAGGWRLFTDPAMAEVVQRLDSTRRSEKISPAGLETLSIIAYRQPVTKAEIEAIRGVQAGPMLRTLVDRGLVKVTGRADQPGSPLLYGTTSDFLDRFGLASLGDLPRDGELARD